MMSVMMSAMILQQMQDLTDSQEVEHFCFNTLWHFALDITNPSDECAYVCERSIWWLRQIMGDHNHYQAVFSGSVHTKDSAKYCWPR